MPQKRLVTRTHPQNHLRDPSVDPEVTLPDQHADSNPRLKSVSEPMPTMIPRASEGVTELRRP
jgi:hypothetical protein